VQDGHTETLRLLAVELGVNVNVSSKNGKTAVMMAAQVSRLGLGLSSVISACGCD
jgi:hypothetical protein